MNKKYWEKQVKILSAMPRFIKEIALARENLGIPASGMPKDERAAWFSGLFDGTDDIAARYGIDTDYMPNNKKLLDEIDRLRREFNLDTRWVFPLFIHLAGSELNPPHEKRAEVRPKIDDIRLPKEKRRVKRLSIELTKDTTIKDIRDLWDEVKAYQAYMDGDLPSRRDEIHDTTVEKYQRIMQLKSEGKKAGKIAIDYPTLGFLTGEDVRTFVNQIEKRFKKRSALRNVPDLWFD